MSVFVIIYQPLLLFGHQLSVEIQMKHRQSMVLVFRETLLE